THLHTLSLHDALPILSYALNPPRAEVTSGYTVAPDVPADACGSQKRGVLEYWSVVVLAAPQKPLLHCSITPLPYGTARNFCRIRNSGYWGRSEEHTSELQ